MENTLSKPQLGIQKNFITITKRLKNKIKLSPLINGLKSFGFNIIEHPTDTFTYIEIDFLRGKKISNSSFYKGQTNLLETISIIQIELTYIEKNIAARKLNFIFHINLDEPLISKLLIIFKSILEPI